MRADPDRPTPEPVPTGDGHVDLDTLADFDEGLLSGSTHANVAAHVRDCPDCAGQLARLTAVRDALAGLARDDLEAGPSAPDGLLAQLLDGVRTAAAEPAPLAPVHRLPTKARWTATVAAAAGIVIAAAVVVPRLGHQDSGGVPAAGPALASTSVRTHAAGPLLRTEQVPGSTTASSLPPISHSGTDYTAAAIGDQVRNLLVVRDGRVATGGGSAGGGTPGSSATESAPYAAAAPAGGVSAPRPLGAAAATSARSSVTPPTDAASASARVNAAGPALKRSAEADEGQVVALCAAAAGRASGDLLAADFATFDGHAALVLVFPASGDTASGGAVPDVFVSDPTCSSAPREVTPTATGTR